MHFISFAINGERMSEGILFHLQIVPGFLKIFKRYNSFTIYHQYSVEDGKNLVNAMDDKGVKTRPLHCLLQEALHVSVYSRHRSDLCKIF
jgi:hypothetical protein